MVPSHRRSFVANIRHLNNLRTTRVNFTNLLRAPFTCADPKSAKKTVKLSSFIALLGSARVKAARRTLVKLTTGLQMWSHPKKTLRKRAKAGKYVTLCHTVSHWILLVILFHTMPNCIRLYHIVSPCATLYHSVSCWIILCYISSHGVILCHTLLLCHTVWHLWPSF